MVGTPAKGKSICPVCRAIYADGSGDFCRNDGALLEVYVDSARDPTFLGKYKLIGEIGRGGWGTVYAAEHTGLGKRFAIKVISSPTIDAVKKERFEREAKALSLLNHPGVVSVVDYGVEPSPYIVMEYVEGGTLADLLVNSERLSLALAADFFLQLAEILEACHEKNLVHRDIKPANIMVLQVSGRQRLKLLDFGLATANVDSTLTDEGRTIGTPSYMSPEQCVVAGVAGPPSDIYSLGCVMYECLAGKKAVDGPDPQICFYQHVNTTPPRFTTPRSDRMEVELESIILKCLAKDAAQRPQAPELTKRLRALLDDKPPQSRAVVAILTLSILLIVGLTVLAVRKWLPSDSAPGQVPSKFSIAEGELEFSEEVLARPQTFVPAQGENHALIMCISSPAQVRQASGLCRRWARQGYGCILLQPHEGETEDAIANIRDRLRMPTHPLAKSVDPSRAGLAIVGLEPPDLAEPLKGGQFLAAVVMDPNLKVTRKENWREFKNVAIPVFFMVDASFSKNDDRLASAQFCEKAFLLSRGSQIFLNSAHAAVLNNQEAPQSSAASILIDRFWSATISDNPADRAFLLSSRALDSLKGTGTYKWRVGVQD